MTSRPRSRNWNQSNKVFLCFLPPSITYMVLVRVTPKRSARNSKRSIVEVKKLQILIPHKIRRKRKRREFNNRKLLIIFQDKLTTAKTALEGEQNWH